MSELNSIYFFTVSELKEIVELTIFWYIDSLNPKLMELILEQTASFSNYYPNPYKKYQTEKQLGRIQIQ